MHALKLLTAKRVECAILSKENENVVDKCVHVGTEACMRGKLIDAGKLLTEKTEFVGVEVEFSIGWRVKRNHQAIKECPQKFLRSELSSVRVEQHEVSGMDDLLQQRAREVRVFPVVDRFVGLFELLLTILNIHLAS